MADDIDDLLDEVESKFIASSPRKDAKKITNVKVSKPPARPRKPGDEDLDDMISDICDVPEPLDKLETGPVERVVTSAQKRCYPVYLGNSTCAQGMASTMNKRSCDKLRCTDCDFKIVTFDNFQWAASTDYLFLRNNVPDFKKLQKQLDPKNGMRAYACQCKWRNVSEVKDVKTDQDLKWVCGRH
ncbi:protein C8orf37 homolog [Lingula anatina]|uniref:Cilia- and flagella-associated protein 418 n=1 Tax=Lingula anatina TaxID=7574 RepID=A0A1S3J1B3_LINAN|nr:protein C8orf37 homolog [Lingula anatina]|eukprot:XP_013404048.1 protein C8orf37 homolog [Lingula anatina]